MAVLPTNSSRLELAISMPGFPSSSSSRHSSEKVLGEAAVRNLDINQIPEAEEEEEEWTMTQSMEDEEESSNGGPPRKKLRLSKDQSRLLEESFRLNHTLNPKQKEALAKELKLKTRQVEVWFQNRRARSKLKQTEMECEYLKRWFGTLSEQNRRLRREVEELRAIKVVPPTVDFLHGCEPLPASTLTMCPRCERISAATTGKTSGKAAATTMSSEMVLSALKLRQPSAAF